MAGEGKGVLQPSGNRVAAVEHPALHQGQAKPETSAAVAPDHKEGEKEPALPKKVAQALAKVRLAYLEGQQSDWALAIALAKLKGECEGAGLKYIEVCLKHLADLGFDSSSESRICKMTQAAEYVAAKNMAVPQDTSKFPSYLQVHPLSRFFKRPRRAEKIIPEWDALHGSVFNANPAKRPSASAIAKRVAELFAPSTSKKRVEKPQPGLPPEEVKAADFPDWFAKNSADGRLLIQRIRVPKLTPDALAVAIKANWRSLKAAKFIRVEVGK